VNDLNICPHFKSCRGCSEWQVDLSTQLQRKKKLVFDFLQPYFKKQTLAGRTLESMIFESFDEIDCLSVGSGKHRSWFDLQLSANGLGLFDQQRNIVPISTCFLMSEALQSLFDQFQQIKFPDKKISARLRVSPAGQHGLWLDMANEDIKELLTDKKFFTALAPLFTVIEIGQKRKKLNFEVAANQQFKLIDPELRPWFKTQDQILYSFVGSFTQPSWTSADDITKAILDWVQTTKSITEFGAGIGQYTIPLLKAKSYVTVFENNPLALTALQTNAHQHLDRLKLNPTGPQTADLYLVNPPRSGLGSFAQKILESQVEKVIYISCSVESLATDLKILSDNYLISDLKIIDQFPNSKHFETAVLLKLK
jgi:23S rRNA (uracil1939-C5)-methyltransferase